MVCDVVQLPCSASTEHVYQAHIAGMYYISVLVHLHLWMALMMSGYHLHLF